MTVISGVHNLAVIGHLAWVVPHENPVLGTIDYYENPCVHGAYSLQPIEDYIAAARRNDRKCRLVDFIYQREGWNNATFDYHEIDLSGWPALPVAGSKRRNEFRKIAERAADLKIMVRQIEVHEFLSALPLLTWDDSAASFIPMMLSSQDQRNVDFAGTMTPLGYYIDGVCVGLSIVDDRFGQDNVLFNLSLIRVTAQVTASDLTYALCRYASASGYRYLDLWNVALTQREMYKRSFFTGPRQAFCWASKSLLDSTPWIHELPPVTYEVTVKVTL